MPPRLGRRAEGEGNLRLGPGGSLWRYDKGVYRPDGEEWLASFVRDELEDGFRENRLREVRAWCRANTAARLPTQPATDYINVANGILYWKESPPRLVSHSPEVPSIIQIPVAWHPQAECPAVRSFLAQALPPEGEALEFLLQWFGYLLIPSSRLQRALMLHGPQDSGKSTLLGLAEALLGPSAVAHHALQSICDDRFVAADLYGRLANICADLDAKSISNTGRFKEIVAGDPISAEKKYRDHFNYRPFARLVFSANEAPGTSDQSGAYYKRWEILPMTNSLPRENQDPHLIDRLTDPTELSGLLTLAVGGLRQVMRRGRFMESESMLDAAADYRRKTDTVAAWIADRCVLEPAARERDGVLYEDYKQWCQTAGRHPLGAERWRDHAGTEWRDRVEFKRRLHGYPTWCGLRLRGPQDQDDPLASGDVRNG